jgi:transcriptional regulator of acetoin/glycerol metabolism
VPHHAEYDHIQLAKDEVLSGAEASRPVHDSELRRSWQRSQAALGTPGNIREVPQVPDELLDAHLLHMFQAPLTRFADSLEGTGLGLLLADATGHILQLWCGDRLAAAHLAQIGTVRGALLAEHAVGTNGVGTVIATGRSVQVQGVEHFADFYSRAVCTGAPVRHPMTGKLLAVVTLSCDITPRADLLRPMLKSVTQQLEQHVLEVEQPAARRMFNMFLHLSRNQPDPIVAFGPQGLLIQNPHVNQLSNQDLNQIQQICEDGVTSGKYSLELSTGASTIEVTALDPGNTIVSVHGSGRNRGPRTNRSQDSASREAKLVGRSPEWLSVFHQISKHRGSRSPVIIAGESGVGKLSLALGFPFRPDSSVRLRSVVDAAERHVAGGRTWLQQLLNRLTSGETVVIRGIETLSARDLDGMRSVLENTTNRNPVLLTLTTSTRESAEAMGLKYEATTLWVPPLRERTADIPGLWHAFAETLGLGSSLVPRAETLEALQAYRWPGNLKELRSVVGHLVSVGKKGPVSPGDLPAAIQGAKALSLIERIELEAIRKALQEAEGNRAKAAEILGLSRATVYRKIKAYRLAL